MVICDWCNQEMTDVNTKSCIKNTEVKFPGKLTECVR